MGALHALNASGVRVPDDIALASIDNVPESAYTHPPLTSIAPDLDVIAERALTLLDEQTGRQPGGEDTGPGSARRESTPFRLVVRESSQRQRTA